MKYAKYYVYRNNVHALIKKIQNKKSYNSNIKDGWSLTIITNIIIMKNFEILWELPKWNTEIQSEQMPLEKWLQ